ncbi:all-trans retinoic acid-induced differentiation factor [Trichomycterus rosablanca]|uniref:all-trans retinoic acid-induced differentiation factor n=1 Tax=Trichomycterus rosablanca TaxID=2290929 RepID=UPI002F351347
MTALFSTAAASVFCLFHVLFGLFSVRVDCLTTDSQLCHMCKAAVQNSSAVWNFCLTIGQIEGRCCFQHDEDIILGLDLSNCSLSYIEDLHEASSVEIIDLSSNPISNLSNGLFQGFNHLTQLILPIQLECPGGNSSWDKVDVTHDNRLCTGQRNACNETVRMSWDCPENSRCMPFGPGFFQCSCVYDFHGYKCLREGQFPMLKVMVILGGSTMVVSALLWVTQRRKVKGT